MVDELTESSFDLVINRVIENTTSYLYSAKRSGLIALNAFQEGLIREMGSEEEEDYKSDLELQVKKVLQFFNRKDLEEYGMDMEELRAFLYEKFLRHRNILKMFKVLLKNYSQINLINYGNYEKDKVMVKEMEDGTVSLKYVFHYPQKNAGLTFWDHENIKYYSLGVAQGYDFANSITDLKETYTVTERSWFKGAESRFNKKSKDVTGMFFGSSKNEMIPESYWTSVYVFYTDRVPGISCSIAIPDSDGAISGIVSVSIGITNLSLEYLAKIKLGGEGKVFLLSQKNEMLAYYPDVGSIEDIDLKRAKVKDEIQDLITKVLRYDSFDRSKILGFSYKLKSITKIGDKLYDKAFQASGLEEEGDSIGRQLNKRFWFEHEGVNYIGIFSPFPKGLVDWLVGVIVPEDYFLGEIKDNVYVIVLITLISIILSISLGLLIAGQVSDPVKSLVDETRRIQNFELRNEFRLDTSLMELSQLGDAFENMKKSLCSFEKFVPSDLVKYLIRSGKEADLGGDKRVLTIYFSDIAGFTNISELLSTENLVNSLGDYLEEMSNIILENKGTVDKYIGDAIMAFWGAPEEVEEHAYLACKSAIESQRKLRILRYDRWKRKGMPLFESRIGLNTGEVIVGNMGSQNRLNYSVLGDSVNLASRLEGLNKYYGTSILCGQKTYDLVKGRITGRKLDVVAVKGKSEPVSIYEIVGFKDSLSSRENLFINRYQEALELYFNRLFLDSRRLFKEIRNIKMDISVENFIHRCEFYINQTPPDNWNGVYVFDKK